MNSAVKAGILLGIVVEIWTAIVMVAGWHKDPALALVFLLVIPIQITIVIMALKGTASQASYGKQVLNGLVLSLVAAVIIVVGSYILTTVAFPNYFEELRAAGVDILTKAGRTPEQIASDMKSNEAMYDPVQNALMGGFGTVVTGLVVSVIAAFFLRKK